MLKRKFYAVGHNPNNPVEAAKFLQAGFNALGPDLNYKNGQYYISHDELPDSEIEKHSLINYLAELRQLVELQGVNLALICFDVKAPVFNINNFIEVLQANYLQYPACSGTAIVITTAHLKDAAFVTTYNGSLQNVGVGIDQHSDPFEVYEELKNQPTAVYGNGITTFLSKPGLYKSIAAAKHVQALGGFKMVIAWVLAQQQSIRSYLQLGVDAILTDLNDTETLLQVLNEPWFAGRFELAQMGHNPFSTAIPAYALTIKTSNSLFASTDGQIRFTLTGKAGHIELIIDAGMDGILEKDSVNYFAIEGKDIGEITSLTIEFVAGGVTSGWLPETIKAESLIHAPVTFTYGPNEWIDRQSKLLVKSPDANESLLV